MLLAPLHPVSRRHLDAMTGALGIFQHASGRQPDPAHGHCVDDVARALEVDLLHARTLGWNAVAESASRSIRFLEDAFDESSGRFLNFRGVDGEWIGGPGSNDSLGRAMLGLGETIAESPDARLVERAIVLFGRALPAAERVTSPRSQASVVLSCAAVIRAPALPTSNEERDAAMDLAATATMMRRPLKKKDHCGSTPRSLSPRENTPTISAPKSAPQIEPRPPKSEMPPITTAVIDWMLSSCPEVGDTDPIRPISAQPAKAQIRPDSM